MSKKPKKIPANYICIAIIALSVVITASTMFNDVKQTVDDAGGVDAIVSGSPAEDIIVDFENIGRTANEAKDELPMNWDTATKKTDSSQAEEEPEDFVNEKHEATFVRAKDGDTYVLSVGGVENTVRLIGVDTPESVAPESYSKENTEEGKEASEAIKNKLHEGDTVLIEFDTSETDRYGRFLCYVYFEDGTMVQDWLLENGYARTMTIAPNIKYADHFKEIQKKAAEDKVGFWNGFFEEETKGE